MPSSPSGFTVAALAEAMQMHAANEQADRLREPWGEQNAHCADLVIVPTLTRHAWRSAKIPTLDIGTILCRLPGCTPCASAPLPGEGTCLLLPDLRR